MACRGCSSDGCNCSVTGDGTLITVSGSGTPVTDPYLIELDVDEALGSITIDDATDCTLLDTPRVPVVLGSGATKLVPLPCYDNLDAAIPGQAFAFTWDGNTDLAPAIGHIQFNNADPSLTTQIIINETEFYGTNVENWATALDDVAGMPKGMFKVYSRSDNTVWASFRVTDVDPGVTSAQREFDVTYVDHSGVFSDVVPGDIVLDFAPASEGSLGGFNSIQPITTLVAAYTFVLGDQGEYFRCGAGPYTLTVPTNAAQAFDIGTHIDIIQTAAGTITVAGAVGVTVNAAPGYDLNGQWASASLIKVGTDEWDLVGNLTA